MTTDAPIVAAVARRGNLRRAVLYGIGVLLLAAAVFAVASRTDVIGPGVQSARSAPAWMVALVLLLPVVNVSITAASFFVLTRRFGRIGYAEMLALIFSSWLLNHLPMRPGLVGRVAYHKAVNTVPVFASIRVIGEQIVCGATGLGGVLLVVLATRGAHDAWIAAGAGAIAALAIVAATIARGPTRAYALVVALRIADCGVWMLRYSLLFAIVGRPLSWHDAAAVAVASQVAMLSPVPLGLREWAVGLTSAAVAGGALGAASIDAAAPGVAADLVNRVAELAVAGPLGLAAGVWVWRRLARQTHGDSSHTDRPESV
ncbi:MAG: hypothetical protein KF699_08165 [Phycisphaeraceae bacterium]|nr:hypothetical protein [Phycisphaeraceae bacterium]